MRTSAQSRDSPKLLSEPPSKDCGILMTPASCPKCSESSDRILVMRQGRLVAEFGRAEATPENVGAAMMSEPERRYDPVRRRRCAGPRMRAPSGRRHDHYRGHLFARQRRALVSQEGILVLLLVVLFVGVGCRLMDPGLDNITDLFKSTSYIAVRGDRHVDAHHHRQHRHFRRLGDRGAVTGFVTSPSASTTPACRCRW